MRALALLTFLLISPSVAAETAQFFDIRLSQEKSDIQTLERLQSRNPTALKRSTAEAKVIQATMQELQSRPAELSFKLADELGTPEIIAPARGRRVITQASKRMRDHIARDFIQTHAKLFGLTRQQVADLSLDASYANPAGNLQWVRFKQSFNGFPVFRGEVTVALTPEGEVVRSVGQLAAFIDSDEAATLPQIAAVDAVREQFTALALQPPPNGLMVRSRAVDKRSSVIDAGANNPNIKASLIYFPLGKGVLELAWSMTIEDNPDAWFSVVSATDGSLLFRKNLTSYEAHTYRAYTGGSPAPFIPGPTDPTLGEQAPRVPATDITVDSQSTNGDPWLAVGITETDGNNVEAGIDRDGVNGVDASVAESGANQFLYSSNPPPGNPAPGDDPLLVASQNAAVVNYFYWVNRFHDLTYDLGFTEPARNFQQDNYGRGGVAGDRISAEAQDSAGTNNANFATPADGGRGRLQMFLWTGATPDRDGSMDADIVLHELTHGLASRLHFDATGLAGPHSGGLAEGWGDFYAHAFLSSPSDPMTSVYSLAGYSTYLATSGHTSNYFYGIRRFPTAVMTATGGPGNLPFNPLTFADIDPAQIDLTDGAYPRGPFGSNQANQTHNLGEVWSTILWEARGQLIAQHGALEGNQRMLQLVTDGMKLDPANPAFIDARDAILAADCASYGGEDEVSLWKGFALRGLGASAQGISVSQPTRVVEAFDAPVGSNLVVNGFSNLSCSVSPRNPTPGETIQLEVQLSNTLCGTTANNVVVQIVGGQSIAIGNINPGESVTASVPYTIPGSASCGSNAMVELEVSSSLGTQVFQHAVPVGVPNEASVEYSNLAPMNLPSGQPATTNGPADLYPSTINVSGFDAVTRPVTGIEVVLHGLFHAFPGDIDVLLEAPDGRKMVILSDVWGGTDANNIEITIADSAASLAPFNSAPINATESVKPTNGTSGDTFDPPAPVAPYSDAAPVGGATFADFAGMDPNGNWNLFIRDDAIGDVGHLDGGWSLRVLYEEPPVCEDCLLTLGVAVSGLAAGNNLTLQNNDTNDLLISSNGGFLFSGNVEPGDAYNVTVSQQPTAVPQYCSVNNGSGTVGASNVTNVTVTCGSNQFSIGGQANGLLPGESVQLQLNASESLSIAASGAFAFTGELTVGTPYNVSILSSTLQPGRYCRLFQASGTVTGGDVTNIVLDCVPISIFADGYE